MQLGVGWGGGTPGGGGPGETPWCGQVNNGEKGAGLNRVCCEGRLFVIANGKNKTSGFKKKPQRFPSGAGGAGTRIEKRGKGGLLGGLPGWALKTHAKKFSQKKERKKGDFWGDQGGGENNLPGARNFVGGKKKKNVFGFWISGWAGGWGRAVGSGLGRAGGLKHKIVEQDKTNQKKKGGGRSGGAGSLLPGRDGALAGLGNWRRGGCWFACLFGFGRAGQKGGTALFSNKAGFPNARGIRWFPLNHQGDWKNSKATVKVLRSTVGPPKHYGPLLGAGQPLVLGFEFIWSGALGKRGNTNNTGMCTIFMG